MVRPPSSLKRSHVIVSNASRFGAMVGVSPQIQQIFGILKLFAGHDFPVLLQGETGTGKELAARAIHDSSARAGKPFVPINCGSIPENLIESELFGYEKGAFSGAHRKDGAFQLPVEPCSSMSLGVSQAPRFKLLRALESMEVRRVGATHSEFLQVRIIAATHRDLFSLIREGNSEKICCSACTSCLQYCYRSVIGLRISIFWRRHSLLSSDRRAS